MDSTPELFTKALRVKLNGEAYWKYVRKLRERGSRETYSIAKRLCRSREKHSRVLGIDVLCQLRNYDKAQGPMRSRPVFVNASIGLIRPMLRDKRIDVFLAAIYALGHLDDPTRSRWISRFAHHRDRDVRYAVTYALGGDPKPLSIRTLVRLTEDKDPKIRDWATFGIGENGYPKTTDSPRIRTALFRRLHDTHLDPRGEAMVGLAARKDPRVIEYVLRELRRKDSRVYALLAAKEFADPVFLPALRDLRRRVKKHSKAHSYWFSQLQDAIKACTLKGKRNHGKWN